ncbi:hypothetical protein JQ620_33870 [Bradyrhizobium sp. AUGA SZCCT0274]|nr:hypothetical protein [Bradyrhizobium sp. AUGA SZCCT0274]
MTRKAVRVASQADALFCNVDTLEARHIADLIGSAFLIPLFEVGVSIPTKKTPDGGQPSRMSAAVSIVLSRADRRWAIAASNAGFAPRRVFAECVPGGVSRGS